MINLIASITFQSGNVSLSGCDINLVSKTKDNKKVFYINKRLLYSLFPVC